MTPEEALGWLRQVKGQLYRNKPHPSGNQAWVAVVRTPRNGRRGGKLIVALGSSMEEAAAAAEGQWRDIWHGMSQTH
jgi:hypothetical protein